MSDLVAVPAAKLGVKSLQVIMHSGADLVDALLDIAKDGFTARDFFKLTGIIDEIAELSGAISKAVDEAQDIDADEAAELGREVYLAVVRVAKAVKKFRSND